MPLVTIEREALERLTSAAQSHCDDLTTGLADGTYEEGADELEPLEAAIAAAQAALDNGENQTAKPAIELLCRLRVETRDWQEALSGEREGLDELCAEIDSAIAERAAVDGYLCGRCTAAVPHDSDTCPHCGRVDSRN